MLTNGIILLETATIWAYKTASTITDSWNFAESWNLKQPEVQMEKNQVKESVFTKKWVNWIKNRNRIPNAGVTLDLADYVT